MESHNRNCPSVIPNGNDTVNAGKAPRIAPVTGEAKVTFAPLRVSNLHLHAMEELKRSPISTHDQRQKRDARFLGLFQGQVRRIPINRGRRLLVLLEETSANQHPRTRQHHLLRLIGGACHHGENVTDVTRLETPTRVPRQVPVARSHSRTVLSNDADARTLQSGENTIDVIPLEWPSRVLRQVPVAGSHSLTVLSRDPDARNLPSGENLTSLTSPLCPRSTCKVESQPEAPLSFL